LTVAPLHALLVVVTYICCKVAIVAYSLVSTCIPDVQTEHTPTHYKDTQQRIYKFITT